MPAPRLAPPNLSHATPCAGGGNRAQPKNQQTAPGRAGASLRAVCHDLGPTRRKPPLPARCHRRPLLAALAALLIAAAAPQARVALGLAAAGGAGPLGLADVALVQRDVQMSLRISTSGAWQATELTSVADRALCVTLVHGEPAIARGRVCVTSRRGQAGLSYTAVTADGTALAPRRLAARVSRPAPSVLEATFLPAAAGLAPGPYSWWAHAAWTDAGDCLRTCEDRFPDDGAVAASLGLLGLPACFGAAARDPVTPCENPELRLAAEPPPESSYVLPPPYCDTLERSGPMSACAFGTPAADAATTFALVGDSHAAGFKPTLQVATLARRWRGVSILRSSCPPTAGVPRLPTRARSRACLDWNRRALAWLLAHPEVTTVFLAAHVGASVVPQAGQSAADAARAGYRDLIAALVAAGRRVVVIRDPPTPAPRHLRCVAAAMRAGRPPGPACARRRASALRPDPLAAAARELGPPQARVVDLTARICDRRRCFAVVGGALVNRNHSHMAAPFAASLGPYLLRALRG